jgi:hypothetical protein
MVTTVATVVREKRGVRLCVTRAGEKRLFGVADAPALREWLHGESTVVLARELTAPENEHLAKLLDMI